MHSHVCQRLLLGPAINDRNVTRYSETDTVISKRDGKHTTRTHGYDAQSDVEFSHGGQHDHNNTLS